MTHNQALTEAGRQVLTPPDKFDRHMARARVQDINSRKNIFDNQTHDGVSRRDCRKHINTSIY